MVPFLFILAGVCICLAMAYMCFDYGAVWSVVVLLVIGISSGVFGIVLAVQHEEDTCHRNGGTIQGTGHYYPITTVIMAGKVAIPITTMHEETACVIL